MNKGLPLYEFSRRYAVAWIKQDGVVEALDGRLEDLPRILFADIPVIMRLSCDITVLPKRYANEKTGPKSWV